MFQGDLTPLERRLVEHAAEGAELDCAPNGGVTDAELDEVDDWDERKIRAEVIVALCTGEVPEWSVHPRWGLQLRGANVVGLVDLSRAQLNKCPLAFHTCHFEEGIALTQATTADLHFTSCKLPLLYGDELDSSASLLLIKTRLDWLSLSDASFRSSVALSEAQLVAPEDNLGGIALFADRLNASTMFLLNTHVEGGVRLVGANIRGPLNCIGAHLINPKGDALTGDGLQASFVYLNNAHVEGRVRLLGAKISGNLDCIGAHLINQEGRALSGDSLDVGNVNLRDNLRIEGEVWLPGARIRGDLNCSNAYLISPKGYALFGRSLNANNIFLSSAHVEGEVRLLQARIRGDLYCYDAYLTNPQGYALVGDGLNASSVFLNRAHVKGEVHLVDANLSGTLEGTSAHLINRGRRALAGAGLNASAVVLHDVLIEGEVHLGGANIRNALECIGAHLISRRKTALTADVLNASNVYLRNSVKRKTLVKGEVSLLGAKIRGQLDCSGADLINPKGDALSADGLSASAVFLRHNARVQGRVHLVGANISGALSCNNALLVNRRKIALDATALAASDFRLSRARVKGGVSLLEAQIRGELNCTQAHLTNPGGIAFVGARLHAGAFFLTDARVEGELLLQEAKISDHLDFSGAHLSNPEGDALSGRYCRVVGAFRFRLAKPPAGKIVVSYAQIGTLDDDLASWPDSIDLVGFSYDSLKSEDNDPSQRLAWLGRNGPFSPEIYSKLAEVYRRSGREGHARTVAIERERKRGRQPDLGWWVRGWNLFLEFTVAYGYRLWQALIPFVVFFVLGLSLFSLPAAEEAMVSAPHNYKQLDSAAHADCQDYPCFTPLVYVLDVMLPVVDLHQESNWVPAGDRRWGWLYEGLMWVLIFIGWILTTAVAAGIGHVVARRASK